ncbi:leucine-rich colipase-like protein 1 isoform X2 [Octodon degus]|uniref:Leucine-rich colipase-like protein 1 isoform X2 n=1 Tax=Octodon degus TaxID=10160 RepID=A0A6P6EVM2_OCTDE|nr:leucine-rich colipase-like protein 1 isoform X2 [Octodon degus]
MAGVAWMWLWRPLLLLLWAASGPEAWNKGMGEPCEEHQECRSGCCVPNSLNPQRFCTAQTFFQHCSPWHKPNDYQCDHHWECQSNCCVQIGLGMMRACMPKTIFLQCVPWRKAVT